MMAQIHHRILVVDDEPDVLVILRRIVRDCTSDYDVVAVTNAAAAVQYLAQHPCALVITDYAMPSMTGLDLALHIGRTTPQTPVILITAYGNETLRQATAQAHVAVVLHKPFEVSELVAAIQGILSMGPRQAVSVTQTAE
ncbi:MAG: response regulator [Herpetosiphon sp.]